MIVFIVAGLIIGSLARLVKPGQQDLGLVATLLLGLAGSAIGGGLASLLATGTIRELNLPGFIAAVLAALILLGIAEGITSTRHKRIQLH